MSSDRRGLFRYLKALKNRKLTAFTEYDNVIIARESTTNDLGTQDYYMKLDDIANQVVVDIDTPIGNEMHVSTLGDDSTAVPYDLMRHYNTIEVALAQARTGDTIVVHAGNWVTAGNLAVDGISIHFMEGAVLRPSFTPFSATDIDVNVTGDAEIILDDVALGVIFGTTTSYYFECKSITNNSGTTAFGFTLGGNPASAVVKIKEDVILNDGALASIGLHADVIIEANRITNNRDDGFLNQAVNSISIGAVSGAATVKVNKHIAEQGALFVYMKNILFDSSVYVECSQAFHSHSAYRTLCFLLEDDINHAHIKCNIYANEIGSTTSGIQVSENTGDQPQNVVFEGDIYVDDAWAVGLNTAGDTGAVNKTFTYRGDIYANSTNAYLFVSPCAFGIQNNGGGPTGDGWTAIDFRGGIYQQGDAACIYKGMQNNFGGDSQNNLTLNATLVTAGANTLIGEIPNGITNDVVIQDVISNTAAGPNITQLGNTITVLASLPNKVQPIIAY